MKRLLSAGWIALLLVACTSEAPPTKPASPGKALYDAQKCSTCHGADHAGGFLGPSLVGAAPNWTREELVKYLRDPSAYVQGNERLTALKKRFAVPMTGFAHLSAEERGQIADYVLGL